MKRLLIALSICLLAGVPAAAIESHTGTVSQVDDTQVIVKTDSGEQTIEWTDDMVRPDDIETGDAVVVRFDADAPSEVLLIHDQVQVADADLKRYHAIAGTVQQFNAEHMILETPNGQEAFVIYPDKLVPPVPEPGQRVAVVYRETGTSVKYGQFAASEIIELDDSLNLAQDNVEVSYSEMEQPQAETQVAETSEREVTQPETTQPQMTEPQTRESTDSAEAAYETETERTLPQTASSLPLIGLIGLLAALGWIALGVLRR